MHVATANSQKCQTSPKYMLLISSSKSEWCVVIWSVWHSDASSPLDLVKLDEFYLVVLEGYVWNLWKLERKRKEEKVMLKKIG